MNAEETRRAAQVMLDSLKPGAVVEYRERDRPAWRKIENRDPVWDFGQCDYRIAEPNHTKIADLPPVCWVRAITFKTCHLVRGTTEKDNSILFGSNWMLVETLTGTHEYSADRINWTPFV